VGSTTTPQVTACDSPTQSRRHARRKKSGKKKMGLRLKEVLRDGESEKRKASSPF